jgi:LPXTG-site transpeptidase (sortase) family protein
MPIKRILKKNNINNVMITGIALVALSVIILLSIFYPVLKAELAYFFSGHKNVQVVGKSEAMVPVSGNSQNIEIMKPVDENFGIVIPKIGVNSKVIPDVDPENGVVYQKALTEGVAQALGSKYPGEEGNVFIFAHSGQDFLEANRYNAVFYLLSKLETGDEILIFYQNKKYRYAVTDKKTVFPSEVNYMDDTPGRNTLTLMTCWPGGTIWKRLIVQAEQR